MIFGVSFPFSPPPDCVMELRELGKAKEHFLADSIRAIGGSIVRHTGSVSPGPDTLPRHPRDSAFHI